MATENFTRDAQGRIYTTTATPDANSRFRNGIAFDVQGRVHVTSTQSGTDTWINGMRRSAQGAIVIVPGIPPARPYAFVAGLPYDKRDGSLIRQENQTPAATDPYVAGTRVGLLGGVYTITGANVPPEVVNDPVISGTPLVGIVSTYNPGSASGTPAPTQTAQRWYVAGVQVSTAAMYTPVAGNTGKPLTVQVDWTNTGGTVTGVSAAKSVTAAPIVTAQPAINGVPVAGIEVSYTAGSASGYPVPTVTAQRWRINGFTVGTGLTYIPDIGEIGKTLTVQADWTNSVGAATGVSPGVVIAASVAPVLDAPFMSSLPAEFTFTRNSIGTYVDAAGLMQTSFATPRFDHDVISLAPIGCLLELNPATNIENNGNATGAVPGTPGNWPSGWGINTNRGLTQQIVASGSQGSIGYVDVRFSGTLATVSAIWLWLGYQSIPVTPDTQYTASVYTQLLANTGSALQVQILAEGNASGQNKGPWYVPIGGTRLILGRNSETWTSSFSDTVITLGLVVEIQAGAIDFTLRIGGWQCEAGLVASSYIPTTGTVVTREPDVLRSTGAGLASWYNPPVGTVLIEAIPNGFRQGTAAYGSLRIDSNSYMRMQQPGPGTISFESMPGALSLLAYQGQDLTGNLNYSAFSYGSNGLFAGGSIDTAANGDTEASGEMPNFTATELAMCDIGFTSMHLQRVKAWNVFNQGGQLTLITEPGRPDTNAVKIYFGADGNDANNGTTRAQRVKSLTKLKSLAAALTGTQYPRFMGEGLINYDTDPSWQGANTSGGAVMAFAITDTPQLENMRISSTSVEDNAAIPLGITSLRLLQTVNFQNTGSITLGGTPIWVATANSSATRIYGVYGGNFKSSPTYYNNILYEGGANYTTELAKVHQYLDQVPGVYVNGTPPAVVPGDCWTYYNAAGGITEFLYIACSQNPATKYNGISWQCGLYSSVLKLSGIDGYTIDPEVTLYGGGLATFNHDGLTSSSDNRRTIECAILDVNPYVSPIYIRGNAGNIYIAPYIDPRYPTLYPYYPTGGSGVTGHDTGLNEISASEGTNFVGVTGWPETGGVPGLILKATASNGRASVIRNLFHAGINSIYAENTSANPISYMRIESGIVFDGSKLPYSRGVSVKGLSANQNNIQIGAITVIDMPIANVVTTDITTITGGVYTAKPSMIGDWVSPWGRTGNFDGIVNNLNQYSSNESVVRNVTITGVDFTAPDGQYFNIYPSGPGYQGILTFDSCTFRRSPYPSTITNKPVITSDGCAFQIDQQYPGQIVEKLRFINCTAIGFGPTPVWFLQRNNPVINEFRSIINMLPVEDNYGWTIL